MTEKYNRSIVNLIDQVNLGEPISRYGEVVEISNESGVKFHGILVGKSIVIPISAGHDTEDSLKNIVNLNLLELNTRSRKNKGDQTCALLGLPYNGNTLGIYSDGVNFGQIDTVHLYPKGYIATQEEFMCLITYVFMTKNLKIILSEERR